MNDSSELDNERKIIIQMSLHVFQEVTELLKKYVNKRCDG